MNYQATKKNPSQENESLANDISATTANYNLKASNYNYFILSGDNFIVGYNFLYRTVIKIPAEAFVRIDKLFNALTLKSVDFNDACPEMVDLPNECIEALKDAHFLIDKDIDELSVIKFSYNRSLYANDSLSLVILPTLWCNLKCPYCFEYKKEVFMNPETEDALVGWIETFKTKQNISVAWFGGEPLLAKKTIFRLTERIKEFCSTINADYSASLTTNGFFLDREFQSALPDLNIRNVQITLDGDKNTHDNYRRQLNNEGSFERIFENITSFCDNVEDCSLTLRINCSDDNYSEIENLIKKLPIKSNNKVSVFFRWIWPNEASGFRDFACSKRGDEPFNGLYKLYDTSQQVGLKTNNPNNSISGNYCEVDFLDHFTIDPEGNLFLCTHTFDKSEAIGSILGNRNPSDSNRGFYSKWYSLDPFNDKDCIECKLLPVCLGGCRKSRMDGKHECIDEKGSIDLFVKNIINEKLQLSSI